MKTLIIYYSKTGFTKKYATWLAEEVKGELVPWKEAQKRTDFSMYDTLIFASWFHAGRVQKLSWFKQLPASGKKRAVLATGATPSAAPQMKEAMEQNFPQEEGLSGFYVQGGLSYEKMGAMDKAIMKMFAGMVKKNQGEDSPEYKGVSQSFDACDKKALAPLVEFLQEKY